MKNSSGNYWLKRFDNYDIEQSKAYEGSGHVGPIPSLGYTPAQVYGWGESYVLKGYLGVYRATNDTAYLDRFIEDVDAMFPQMEDFDNDQYTSWWTSAYSVQIIMNGNMEKDSIYYKDSAGVYMTDGWYPYPWYGRRGSVYRVNTEKVSGTYSLYVESSPSEAFVGAYTILPTYTPGKQYILRFNAKNKQPNAKGKIMVVRQDTGEAFVEFTFSNEKWTSYSFDFVMPDEAGLQLRVYLTNEEDDGQKTGTYYDDVSLLQYGEHIVLEGMTLASISEFVDLVENNDSLDHVYRIKAKEYLKIIEKNFYWKWDKHWVEWEDHEGTSMGVYVFPFDDTARMTQINEYFPFVEPSKGVSLPHNQYAAAARTLVNLYRITNSDKYLNKIIRMGHFLKHSLREKVTDRGNSGYVWNYWENTGQKWDFGYFRYKTEDISHANIELGFAVDLYQLGLVFTLSDMQRFTNTFKDLIWQGDYTNPRVSEFVDGSGNSNYSVLVTEWLTLSQFDEEIKDISLSLLGRPKDPFGATYGMILIGNLLRYHPDLLLK